MPLDAHSTEQDGMLRAYHFGDAGHAEPQGSVSPFVPCASRRIPAVLRAARLTSSDCFWDLGCGDGRMCHQAASQHDCHCVGVEIIAACVDEARARASEQQLASLCRFAVCDLTALQPGALHPDASGHADLGDAVLGDGPAEPLRVPTCVVLFITSHGLSRLKGWLRDEWARGGLRIITCVERLDSCFDFEAEDPLFGSEASDDLSWPIYTAHERDGVFVVPPKGVSVAEWAADEPSFAPRPPLTRGLADASEHAVVHALLSDADIATIVKLGEAALLAQAADAPDTIDLFASNAPTDAR